MENQKEEKWNCDFCGKAGLSIAEDGMIYCKYCFKSYRENMYDVARKIIKEMKNGQKKSN